MKNIIEETLLLHLKEKNTCFVFPTQTACDLWEDWIIVNTPVKAVASDRFIAWDDFKGSSIKSRNKDKKSIPSVMRKIFVDKIISENAEKFYFKNIILEKYAKSAGGFSDWICSVLPGLSMWKKFFDNSGLEPDGEDRDFLKLYELYSAFLDKYSLFDPAWETPPFVSDGNKYFIFFPEILSDYFEYENLLEQSKDDIVLVKLPLEFNEFPAVNFYQNFRQELKSVAFSIREAHLKKGIPWQNIAVSVSDIENYAPYIQREFSIYEIPFVIRGAQTLSATRAGNLFSLINECAQNDYSFESLKALLLNTEFPWKNPELIAELIQFGKKNNCICSFDYEQQKYDVWLESFKNPVLEKGEKLNERLVDFYKSLKKSINAIVYADSFEQVRKNYFSFRETFFDVEKFRQSTNNVLSRCVVELAQLVDLESEFEECKISSPYAFFVNYLKGISYLEQAEENGVQVLPYKTASCAAFDMHIVIDAGQSELSVIYKQLSFLRDDKRKLILGANYEDPVVTEKFISAYVMNSMKENALFTCAEKTLTGYAQPLSCFTENKIESLDLDDEYKNEADFYAELKSFPKEITLTEKKGFNQWKNVFVLENQEPPLAAVAGKNTGFNFAEKIREKMYDGEKLCVSYSNLNNFLYCPRIWILKYILGVGEQVDEAELMAPYAMGDLYHKVMENYCNRLKEKNLVLYTEEAGLTKEYDEILQQSVKEAILGLKASYLSRQLVETTEHSVYVLLKSAIESFSSQFSGCTVYGMEQAFNVYDEQSVYIGRLDCLLYDSSENEFFLVDFKTSDNAIPKTLYAEDALDELPDFQIPMYVKLCSLSDKKINVENACFFNIKDASVSYVFGEKLFSRYKELNPRTRRESVSRADFERTMDVFKESVDDYVQKIKNLDFSVTEENQDYAKCSGCLYNAACRRYFVVGKK